MNVLISFSAQIQNGMRSHDPFSSEQLSEDSFVILLLLQTLHRWLHIADDYLLYCSIPNAKETNWKASKSTIVECNVAVLQNTWIK